MIRHAILALTVTVSGALLGSGLTALLAARLLTPSTMPLAPATAPAPAPRPAPPPSPLAGHLFPPPSDDPPAGPGAPPSGGPCADGWSLVGALVDRQRPERSVIAVHAPDGAAVLGPGAAHGALTVVEVTHASARLRDADGRECALAMFASTTPSSTASSTMMAVGTDAASRSPSDGPTRVRRAAFEAARRRDPPVRVRPVPPAGARISGIRRGTLLHDLGLRDGDVIRAVDGTPLSSPSVGLDAYGRLMRGDAIRVTVERDGRAFEAAYALE